MNQPHHEGEGLKPCPFCGGEAEFKRKGNARVSTIVTCSECGATLENGEVFNHGTAWNRRPTPAEPKGSGGDKREAVARLIDPGSWRVFDGYLAEMLRKYKGQNAAYDPEAFKDKASLAKADDIIALLTVSPTPAARDVEGLCAEAEAWLPTAVIGPYGSEYLLRFVRMVRSLSADLAAKEAAHEKELLKEIASRDRFEDAISQAYYLVTGRSPEWSNMFGITEAHEEISETVDLLKAAVKQAQADLAAREAEIARLTIDLGKHRVAAEIDHDRVVLLAFKNAAAEQQVQALKALLVEASIPLEVLVAQHAAQAYRELSPSFMERAGNVCVSIRAALATSTVEAG